MINTRKTCDIYGQTNLFFVVVMMYIDTTNFRLQVAMVLIFAD